MLYEAQGYLKKYLTKVKLHIKGESQKSMENAACTPMASIFQIIFRTKNNIIVDQSLKVVTLCYISTQSVDVRGKSFGR